MSSGLIKLFAPALLTLCVFLSACAERSDGRAVPPTALAMDGPRLAVVGEYAGMSLEGDMDRTCMAGYGMLELRATEDDRDFSCAADFDEPPTEKGRVRGLLKCSGGRTVLVSLRNLGPDQGAGIGRETEEGDLMVFFYHASREEAERRFPSVKEDIALARASGKQ
jgi:hypothetical protein